MLSSLIDGRFQSEEFFELQANTTFLGSFRPERFVLMKPMEQLDGLKTDMLRDRLRRGFHASDPFPYRDCVIMFLHGEHDREAVGRAAEEYDLYAVISEPLQSLYALGRATGGCAGCWIILSKRATERHSRRRRAAIRLL